LKRKIRAALDGRPRKTVEIDGFVSAAVLLLLLDRPGGVQVLFAKRSEQVANHKGQISFPGGIAEDRDPSLLHTALREAQEEIGLPVDSVEMLGSLDDMVTVVTRFVITPFVGLVGSPLTYKPDGREIERVIEVPLQTLLDPANFRTELWVRDGAHQPMYFYDYRGEIIWGATAGILKQFLDLVFGVQAC